MTLEQLHAEVADLQRDAEQAAARFHAAVAAALADGQSAAVIAERLGVTRARVYQWRDKGRQ